MKGKKKGFFFCFIFLSKRELFNCRILCPCVELYSRMYPDHYITIIERKRKEHTNLLLVSVLFCIQFIWEIVLTLFVQLKHLFKKRYTHSCTGLIFLPFFQLEKTTKYCYNYSSPVKFLLIIRSSVAFHLILLLLLLLYTLLWQYTIATTFSRVGSNLFL